MSGEFRIDIPRVEKMVDKLGESTERMQEARTRLKKVGPKTLGTDGLDEACDTFQSEWEDGIKRIEGSAKDIKDRLQTTVDAYKAGEQKEAKNYKQG